MKWLLIFPELNFEIHQQPQKRAVVHKREFFNPPVTLSVCLSHHGAMQQRVWSGVHVVNGSPGKGWLWGEGWNGEITGSIWHGAPHCVTGMDNIKAIYCKILCSCGYCLHCDIMQDYDFDQAWNIFWQWWCCVQVMKCLILYSPIQWDGLWSCQHKIRQRCHNRHINNNK